MRGRVTIRDRYLYIHVYECAAFLTARRYLYICMRVRMRVPCWCGLGVCHALSPIIINSGVGWCVAW